MHSYLYVAAIFVASIGLGYAMRALVDGGHWTNRRLIVMGSLAAGGLLLLFVATFT